MRWWISGLIGGTVLLGATMSNAVTALIRGIDGPTPWADIFGLSSPPFAWAFLVA